jgi:hypothetical protein
MTWEGFEIKGNEALLPLPEITMQNHEKLQLHPDWRTDSTLKRKSLVRMSRAVLKTSADSVLSWVSVSSVVCHASCLSSSRLIRRRGQAVDSK